MMNTSEEFKRACEVAGIPPTKRQSSKWAMKKGLAWKVKMGLAQPLKKK